MLCMLGGSEECQQLAIVAHLSDENERYNNHTTETCSHTNQVNTARCNDKQCYHSYVQLCALLDGLISCRDCRQPAVQPSPSIALVGPPCTTHQLETAANYKQSNSPKELAEVSCCCCCHQQRSLQWCAVSCYKAQKTSPPALNPIK